MRRVLLLIPMLAVLLLQTMSAVCDTRCGAGMTVVPQAAGRVATAAMADCGHMQAAPGVNVTSPMAAHGCWVSDAAVAERQAADGVEQVAVPVDAVAGPVAALRDRMASTQGRRVAGGPPLERRTQLRV